MSKRPKLNRKKLKNPDTMDEFQLELSSRFEAQVLDDQSLDLAKRYESMRDRAEEVLGKQETHGLPSWVSEETIKLKKQRDDKAKMQLVT